MKQKADVLKSTNTANLDKKTVPETLFLFNADYQPRRSPPVDLTDASVETILETMFKFTAASETGLEPETGSENKDHIGESEFKWNGRTIKAIYTAACKLEVVAWLKENDKLDYSKLTPESWKAVLKGYYKLLEEQPEYNTEAHQAQVRLGKVVSYLQLCFDLVSCGPDRAKSLFFQIYSLLPFYRAAYRSSGNLQLPLYIPPDQTSDSAQTHRNVVIPVAHHGVFTAYSQTARTFVPRIPIWVSHHDSDESTGEMEGQMYEGHLGSSIVTSVARQPRRKKDALVLENYRQYYSSQNRKYMFESVPSSLSTADCYTKTELTSRHLAQTLAVAMWEHSMVKKPVYTVIGLFMKRSHIYVSKLTITADRIKNLQGFFTDCSHVKEPDMEVEYSNWYLDMNIPSHRMALPVFLNEYLSNFT